MSFTKYTLCTGSRMVKIDQNRLTQRRRNNSSLKSPFTVLRMCFVNIFVVAVLFSGSGAREQRVCLRMGRVYHKLSRELSGGVWFNSFLWYFVIWKCSCDIVKKSSPLSLLTANVLQRIRRWAVCGSGKVMPIMAGREGGLGQGEGEQEKAWGHELG